MFTFQTICSYVTMSSVHMFISHISSNMFIFHTSITVHRFRFVTNNTILFPFSIWQYESIVCGNIEVPYFHKPILCSILEININHTIPKPASPFAESSGFAKLNSKNCKGSWPETGFNSNGGSDTGRDVKYCRLDCDAS